MGMAVIEGTITFNYFLRSSHSHPAKVKFFDVCAIDFKQALVDCRRSLCPKSPSVQGFVASLPVRLLFKYLSHNAFCPVSSLSQCGI